MENLSEFLMFLFASGGNVLIASWILERTAWYQTFAKEKKQFVFYGVAAVIGIAAWAVATFVPVEIIEQIKPVFTILYMTFGPIFLGELFHQHDKELNKINI